MQIPVIHEGAESFGLSRGPGGAHGNRTIMLTELSALFAEAQACASHSDLRKLVVEDNVLLKRTASNRLEVFARLSVMYGLRPDVAVYRALRRLWDVSEADKPLLALLVALGRDSLLRATAPVVIDAPVGSVVSAGMMESLLPASQSDIGKASVSRHAASSWTQSGHLSGRRPKIRTRVSAGPAALAMALWLGNACGMNGLGLYDTFWVQSLDLEPSAADKLAAEAHRMGLIDYRRIGDVLDIGFTLFEANCGS